MNLSVGLFVIAIVAHSALADDDSHACAQALYTLPEGQIACLALIPRWYHDHASGECKEFSYDGCNKNENNFETKEACDETCGAWHQEHKGHDHGSHKGHTHDHAHEHDHGHDCNNEGHDHSHHHKH